LERWRDFGRQQKQQVLSAALGQRVLEQQERQGREQRQGR
jgi:hypothetical protein